MAKLRKNTIGFPVGKLSGAVYKAWKGIPYVSSEPVFTKPITSPVVIDNNSKFKLFGALTTNLQNDPRIRAAWENSNVKGNTARHKIMHINYSLVDESRDLTNFRLVPYNDLFPVELLDTVIGRNILTLSFAPFALTYSGTFYPMISAHGIVHYSGSLNGAKKERHMIEKISSPVVPYVKGEPHSFSIEWDSDSTTAQSFNSKQFCLTLILENRDGVPAACSVNVIVDVQLK